MLAFPSTSEETVKPSIDSSTSRQVYIGSGVASVLVVLTVLVTVPILCVVVRHHQRPKRMVISNPQSYHGRLVVWLLLEDREYW